MAIKAQVDFDTIRVQEGYETKAVEAINQKVSEGYYPIGVLENKQEEGVTTILLSQGRSVIQRPEPDSSNVFFSVEGNTSSQDFIIIDISDTTNYAHFNTEFINLSNLIIDIDSGGTADYKIKLGFLTNVDGTDGEFVEIYKLSGQKTKGATKQINASFFPNGGRLKDGRWVSSDRFVEAIFSNTSMLPSTLDTGTSNTNPGTGDLVLRIERADSSEINLSISLAYHTGINI